MELFGKILVFVTVGLSLLMAAVGGAALYNRVDWSNNKPTSDQPDQPPGELVGRIQKLQDAQSLLAPADADWSAARAALPLKETRRQTDAVWYADELEHLRTDPHNQALQALLQGNKPDPMKDLTAADWVKAQNSNPIKAIDYQSIIADPNNDKLPTLIDVKDRYGEILMARTAYAAQIAAKDDQVLTAFEGLMKSAQQDTELTIRLIGPEGVTDAIAGVNKQINDLKTKRENDDDATKALKDKLIARLTDYGAELGKLVGPTSFARGLDKRIEDETAKLEAVIGKGCKMVSVPDKKDPAKMVWTVEDMKTLGNNGEMWLVWHEQGKVNEESQLLDIRNRELNARKAELQKAQGKTQP